VGGRAEQLGRRAAFLRTLARLGEEHQVRRVLSWDGRRPEAEPDTRYVEGALGTLWSAWAVRQEVGAFDPDVVVVDGPLPPPARRPAVAVVRDLTLTGWEDVPDPRGWLLRRFRRVVVPSPLVRRQVQAFGVDPLRVHVVPEPLPGVGRLSPAPEQERRIVAQVGAIHPAKRPHLAIDAVSRLSGPEKGAIRLVIAGPARDARYLAQLRVQAEGQPVELVPDPPSLVPTLARAHAVLYPTALDEGSPDAALLALAAGRPVWFADRPALREVLVGLGVPVPEGVEAWRAVLRGLLSGPLPEPSATELDARFGPTLFRRRWREVLAMLGR
jgi:glycosyltransferase involved in cell wall biosynthesis